MSRVLIIGAGGVGSVVAHKCAQVPEVFSEVWLASRRVESCDKIAALIPRHIHTAQVDADNVPALVALLRRIQPKVVINVALPYQDLHIMDACLEAGVDYVDTANYEPVDEARFCYRWQWEYHERFKKAGLMALLGSGFDPGVSNVFCAYAQKVLFDTIETVDILDCNAGSHGHPFATNFNPEINLREITQRGKYWDRGQWLETDSLAVKTSFAYPGVGPRDSYLLYHEELESLSKNLKGLQRIRFWMTFGQDYLTHLRVLQNVGMTRIDAVEFEGHQIVPIKFLKALLPDPGSLGATYTGKTSIGCLIAGRKNGVLRRVFIYNVCDHAECYREVKAQAVSYTTGVPAMVGALLLLTGTWRGTGVFNMEEFDPLPFLARLNQHGLPWQLEERADDLTV